MFKRVFIDVYRDLEADTMHSYAAIARFKTDEPGREEGSGFSNTVEGAVEIAVADLVPFKRIEKVVDVPDYEKDKDQWG